MDIVRAFDDGVKDRRRFTPREIVVALLKTYENSNERLAQRFQAPLPTFFDMGMSDFEVGEYGGISTQELARFMIHIFQDQQMQIRQLRKRLSDLGQ